MPESSPAPILTGPTTLRDPNHPAVDQRSIETASLWERVASSHSDAERALLREEVILLNMPVAMAIAARYRARGLLLDDLKQVACLGLVTAVERFDPGAGKDFLVFAVPTMRGEVKRHFRDLGWVVRPPRRIQELQARISTVPTEATHATGTGPRLPHLAEQLGADLKDVVEALTCNGFSPMSLDVPLGEPGASDSLGDVLDSGRDDYDAIENAIVLRKALESLSSEELMILRWRFWEERTQQEIGVEIGLSQMQVSRMQARILSRLRRLVASAGPDLDLSA